MPRAGHAPMVSPRGPGCDSGGVWSLPAPAGAHRGGRTRWPSRWSWPACAAGGRTTAPGPTGTPVPDAGRSPATSPAPSTSSSASVPPRVSHDTRPVHVADGRPRRACPRVPPDGRARVLGPAPGHHCVRARHAGRCRAGRRRRHPRRRAARPRRGLTAARAARCLPASTCGRSPRVNPDGLAADTRQNAHQVDLNRNWPRQLGSRPPRPRHLRRPQRRLRSRRPAPLRDFLQRLRPRTVLVIHSPLDAVDFSEGADPAVTRYMAARPATRRARSGAGRGRSPAGSTRSRGAAPRSRSSSRPSASATQLSRVARALLRLALWRRG